MYCRQGTSLREQLLNLSFKLLVLALQLLISFLKFPGVLRHHRCTVLCTLDDAVLSIVAAFVLLFKPLSPVLELLGIIDMIAFKLVGFAIEWLDSVCRELGYFFGGFWL